VRIDDAFKVAGVAPFVVRTLKKGNVSEQEWLWYGHFPVGALELNAGKPGIGKGLLFCDIASRITRAAPWPDGSKGLSEPGDVLILSAEDRVEDYERRMAAAGADVERVHILEYVLRDGEEGLFLLATDIDKLEAACYEYDNVKLVCFDPITAYMGSGKGFDSHRTTDVRNQLLPLKVFSERTNIAASAITHPPKAAAGRAVLDNFIGSQAYIAAARAGHYVVEELGEEDERGFRKPTGRFFYTTPKYSHTEPMPTLIYRKEIVVVGTDPRTQRSIRAPRIVWEGTSDMSADEAVAANRPSYGDKRKEKAAGPLILVKDMLAAGPMAQKIIIERGAERGYSLNQMRRALKKASGVSFKLRNAGPQPPTLWAMSKDVPADSVVDGDPD
jgi:hypothetical protein